MTPGVLRKRALLGRDIDTHAHAQDSLCNIVVEEMGTVRSL